LASTKGVVTGGSRMCDASQALLAWCASPYHQRGEVPMAQSREPADAVFQCMIGFTDSPWPGLTRDKPGHPN
jgi:hypothetical protein